MHIVYGHSELVSQLCLSKLEKLYPLFMVLMIY